MNKLTDNDIREALKRREARRTKPEVPADFCADIMPTSQLSLQLQLPFCS